MLLVCLRSSGPRVMQNADAERTREFLVRIDSSVQGDGLGSDYGSDDDGGLLAAMLILSCSDRVAESE